ncbi:uncharacterized protein V6R79_019506 [Siganus canaliculatus]
MNRCLIPIILAFMVQHCWCFSTSQMKKTPEQHALPRVTCSARGMRATFGPRVKNNIYVKDMTGARIPVPHSEESCGVWLGRQRNHSLSFFSRYDSCYAQIEGSKVLIPLQVQLTTEERWFKVNISCPLIKKYSGKNRLISRSLKCDIDRDLQVDCGHHGITRESCYKLGCCYDALEFTCFYRLNDCSLDGHFVFSVKATDADPPIDPGSLVVKDHPQCFPVVITPDTAIFKFRVTECGAIMKVDGDVIIYEVQVQEKQSRTKKSPFSLQVQCEYEASDFKHAAEVRSLNAVTNPPPVVALGTIRVQMRLAEDASFTSFFPEDQLPVSFPLRKAVYVEISIAQPSPDPTLSLHVRDCFAYPASRHSVWTLLYDGCPNPLDNMRSSVPVDNQGSTTSHSQVRRFDVKTFAFLDPHTGHPSAEEMYFYCWVEICSSDADCVQRCTIVSTDGGRQRRDRMSESNHIQLVLLGPFLLGHNNTELEDKPYVNQKTMFQVMVYTLSSVGGALFLLLLLVTVWLIRKKLQTQSSKCTS